MPDPKITLTLEPVQVEALVKMMDAAVRAQGIAAAPVAAELMGLIQAAIGKAQEKQKAAEAKAAGKPAQPAGALDPHMPANG